MARRPEFGAALRREALQVCPGRPPTIDECKRLSFHRAFIEETLRMRGPIWAIARNAVEADEIMDFAIPANGIVVLASYLLHRHRAYWPDPDQFDPRRFATADEARALGLDPRPELNHAVDEYAYLPFSRGPRVCIAANFAMIEMQIILATVVQQIELDSLGQAPEPRARVTLTPREPMRARLRWRT